MPAWRPLPVTSPATMRTLPSVGVRDDLEEVAADFAGGAVLGFDGEAGEGEVGVGEDDLLDFGGVLDVEGLLALGAQREQQAAEEKDEERKRQQQLGDSAEGDLCAEGETMCT